MYRACAQCHYHCHATRTDCAYRGQTLIFLHAEALGRPCAVGLFGGDQTPEGVYDLAGNVAEWTGDDELPYVDFDSVDGERVRIFFPMVAPRHKDRYYVKVERVLAEAFADEDDMSFRDELLAAETPGEVIFLMRKLIDRGT